MADAARLSPRPPPDTRNVILDAAETLFAEHGYAATSLRQLTAAAGVNLAAVNYHFGGKEGLAKAVLERRIAPINAERVRRLDAMAGRRPSVETIVRAFVEPPLRSESAAPEHGHNSPGSKLCRVFGRISVEQPEFLRSFLAAQFREVAQRFAQQLGKALSGINTRTTWWRLHFVIGAMAHTLQNSAALTHLSEGLCNPNDVDHLIEELVAFATGGLKASGPKTSGPKGNGKRRNATTRSRKGARS